MLTFFKFVASGSLFRLIQADDDNINTESSYKLVFTISLILMAATALMSVFNLMDGAISMFVSTAILSVIFLSLNIMIYYRVSFNRISILSCVAVGIAFTYYTIVGGNEGFALIWIFLVPSSISLIYGTKAGLAISGYFFILLCVSFYTPLFASVLYPYPQITIDRFPILYGCYFLINTIIQLRLKALQITQRKTQKAVEDALADAKAANKAKSDFLASTSHEIRTPMNAIIGVTEIQLLRGNLPEDVTKAFKQIHVSGHGLLGIINDILDLSKIETGKLELFSVEYDVASMINDAIQLNMVRAGSKPIVFSLDVKPDLPATMVGDELRLKQVLNNILSNAFKYTDEGTVKLAVSHRVVSNGIELCFVVADTGQGMKPEDLARLFDEYSRFNLSANRSTEGTGLGMNITQKLVKMMNGKISVKSEYGKGSTFTITVLQGAAADRSPIGEEHAERLRNFTYMVDREIHNVQILREPMPYGRVLIVDDVETNLYVAKGLLAPYELTIETASSGFETLDLIADGATYDIVFMDHMMPKMDGVETTSKLREYGYKGTVIALTANAIAGNDKFFKEHGFDDFISKPIDIRQMNAVLNKYVRDKQSEETIKQARLQKQTEATPADTGQFPVSDPVPATGGVDKFLMEIFKRDAGKAIATLTETAANGDCKLFAITAHAMKSATANIGEHALSELAKSLEDAGNAGDMAYISEYNGSLIDGLQRIVAENETALPEAFEEDTAFLHETLNQLCEACDAYDGGTARALIKALAQRDWKPDTVAMLDALSEMVLCSDFEEAAEKAAAFMKQS